MASHIIEPQRVTKIMRSLDKQVALRTHELMTMTRLRDSLRDRQIRGTLQQADLDMVRASLRHMRRRPKH
jgi:hypothetical protein